MRECRFCNSSYTNLIQGDTVLPCKFVDVGSSILLMNCKLTDFSVLSLKLLLVVHIFITKGHKLRDI